MGKKNLGSVADTIRSITKNHLDNGSLIIGQCLSAVGWVQNTIPKQKKGIIELSMTDTAGAGIAVGAAIGGSRPILVLRFQSFLWLNSSPIVMHAAKCKEIFGYDCPIYIRAIASESDNGQGPLHANAYYSIFAHMPGMTVVCPMTPKEFKFIWKKFLLSSNPFLVSEHRSSYKINYEIRDKIDPNCKISIIAISSARIEAIKAYNKLKKNNFKINFINLVWIKPFKINKKQIECLKKSKKVLIIDNSYEFCGVASSIAQIIANRYGCKTYVLGLKEKSPGVAPRYENGTPKCNDIIHRIKSIQKNKI
jgi:pyruvate/2-oxoglutarate/acetoin dehydrogenase E1 component